MSRFVRLCPPVRIEEARRRVAAAAEAGELDPRIRRHEHVARLMVSISSYGFDRSHPVIVRDGELVDGVHRTAACKLLGVEPLVVDRRRAA